MSCDDSATYWAARLTTARTILEAYEAAITALATDSVQSYTLDTGQTRQVVTKAQLAQLRLAYETQLGIVATLEARVCGTTYIGRTVD